MYQIQNSQALINARPGRRSAVGSNRVPRNVVFLGLVSFLTDISAEMVATVLPLYLVVSVGLSPLTYGFIDGLYQGASALVRIASGLVADRWRRHKEVAAVGYGLSALSKLGLVLVGGATGPIAALVFIDRTGKGIRTAPRDAMISLSCSPATVGAAFGVHRAMDTAGALLGPLVAFGLLSVAPGAFDAVFVVSFCIALVGVAALAAFVDGERPRTRELAPEDRLRAADVRRLVTRPGFGGLLALGAALGLVTISDGFLYLGLQRTFDLEASVFPLLFVGTSASYMLLAVPVGRLADRIGRLRVFLGGYGFLLAASATLLLRNPGTPLLMACLLSFGAYYAATDGVLMAVATGRLAEVERATGMGALTTATSLGRLGGSIVFGALWVAVGLQSAVAVFGVALALVLAASVTLMRRSVALGGTAA